MQTVSLHGSMFDASMLPHWSQSHLLRTMTCIPSGSMYSRDIGHKRNGLLAHIVFILSSPFRLSPYGEFGSVADDKPNATNRYLTEQLNKFGLAYLHMVEPRIAGNTEVDVTDKTYNLAHFRKLYNGTFIAAGKLSAAAQCQRTNCSNFALSTVSCFEESRLCARHVMVKPAMLHDVITTIMLKCMLCQDALH